MADVDLMFVNSLVVDETSARKIMTTYYDILRSVVEAISALDGYKVYSHEAFTYFLKEKDEKVFADKFDRFRKIRNSINYYGSNRSVAEVNEAKAEITRMIDVLKAKYLNLN